MRQIILSNVSFTFPHGRNVFQGLTHRFEHTGAHGHVFALMGPSGGGKSTLLRLLAKIISPTSGTISIHPEAEARVNLLSQTPVLFERLDVNANLRLGEQLTSQSQYFNGKLLDHAIEVLQIGDIVKASDVSRLSGGEKQRVALARCLSLQPQILLLDEPCTGIDPWLRSTFIRQLRELIDEARATVFYVTHHYDEAATIADDMVVLAPDRKSGANRLRQRAIACAALDPDLASFTGFDMSPAPSTLSVSSQVDGLCTADFQAQPLCRLILPPKLRAEPRLEIAFDPACVRLIPYERGPARIAAISGRYVVVRVDDTHILADRAASAGMALAERCDLSLRGRVVVYSKQGGVAEWVDIHE